MIPSAVSPGSSLPPLHPQAGLEARRQAGALPGERTPTAPADSVRALGPGVTRPLLDVTSLTALQGRRGHGEKAPGHAALASEEGLGGQLTAAERRLVAELKQQDAEIRRHEAAHASVAGQYGGAPNFQYTTGPDGKRYVVSGEVPIDISPVPGDPKATIAKMQVVKRAASAPADPSAQDRSVAAAAARAETQARTELAAEGKEQVSGSEGGPATAAMAFHAPQGKTENGLGELAAFAKRAYTAAARIGENVADRAAGLERFT